MAPHWALARGRRGPRRGRLRPLRVRALGSRPRGDVEVPRNAEVAELAQVVTPTLEGKRVERAAAVLQPSQLREDHQLLCIIGRAGGVSKPCT